LYFYIIIFISVYLVLYNTKRLPKFGPRNNNPLYGSQLNGSQAPRKFNCDNIQWLFHFDTILILIILTNHIHRFLAWTVGSARLLACLLKSKSSQQGKHKVLCSFLWSYQQFKKMLTSWLIFRVCYIGHLEIVEIENWNGKLKWSKWKLLTF